MKTVILCTWIICAGLILGISINSKAERCGHAITVGATAGIEALSWPVYVIASFVADNESVAWSKCE